MIGAGLPLTAMETDEVDDGATPGSSHLAAILWTSELN